MAGPALHAEGKAHSASSLLLKPGGGLGGTGWEKQNIMCYREAVRLWTCFKFCFQYFDLKEIS